MTKDELAQALVAVSHGGFGHEIKKVGKEQFAIVVVDHSRRVVLETSDIKQFRKWSVRRRTTTRRQDKVETRKWNEKQWKTPLRQGQIWSAHPTE